MTGLPFGSPVFLRSRCLRSEISIVEFGIYARWTGDVSWLPYKVDLIMAMKPSLALASNRDAIRRVVAAHRASNPRVFGSVAHGDDTEGSDLDILIDPTPDTSLFDIGAIRHELLQLLGVPVDVLTPKALPEKFRAAVLAEAVPV